MSQEDNLLRLWRLYPESAKKLAKDPLSAGLEALKEADDSHNWENIDIAVDIIHSI